MPRSDPAATLKWPNVPACYGWLSLDRRGRWLLKGQAIRHDGLVAFINGHYGADDLGNWIFENGPQAVFVALDYTPWVLRLEADGRLTTHTGLAVGPADAAYLDEEGNALLHTAAGIGVVDDRDLAGFVAACRNADGEVVGDDALLSAMTGATGVFWRGVPVRAIKRGDVGPRFGFKPAPAPAP